MKQLLSLILILLTSSVSFAQTTGTVLRGEVAGSEGKAIEGGEVVLLQSDTIAAAAMTNAKGKFEIKNLPSGDYMCHISAYGYKDKVELLSVKGSKLNLPRIVLQKDSAVMLGELTVTADQSLRTKNQAGMTLYQLSDRAKKESDAYLALQEIPRLRVEVDSKRIKLDDGSTPIILIDGVNKPGYLNVLRPDMIESVEVIDNPSARYRASSSVRSVLNIKLKSRAMIQPYINGNASLGLMPPFKTTNESFGVAFWTATSSLTVSANHSYNHNIKNEKYNKDSSPTLERSVLQKYWDSRHNIYASINGDKILNKKNYLSFNLNYIGSPNKTHGDLSGELYNPVTKEATPLTGSIGIRNYYHNLQTDLYYKHSFSDTHLLEITGTYTFSNTGGKSFWKEINDWNPYESKIDDYYTRHLEALNIDYSLYIEKAGTFQAGSSSTYGLTRADDIYDNAPVYKHKEFKEYLYVGFNNYKLQKNFSYNVSLGLDIVSRNSGGFKKTYVEFVPSLSLGYAIGFAHYLNFNYNRNRMPPTMWQLNPFNSSLDEYKVSKGNPYLNPSHEDSFTLGYTYTYKKWRINPYFKYVHTSDIITIDGSLDGDIYTSSYTNRDYQNKFTGGAMINYTLPCGYVGGSFDYSKLKIPGMPFSGNIYSANLFSNIYYKKFSANINLMYYPYAYSALSKSRNPLINSIQLFWRFNRSLYVSLNTTSLLFRGSKYKTWVENGDYRSYYTFSEIGLRPTVMFTVTYSFANKVPQIYRQKKYFQINNPETRD